jgi:hypothetical protein
MIEGDKEIRRLRRGGEGEIHHSQLANLPIPQLPQSPNLSIYVGLLTAAAYTYTLYLLANVYVRGAFGEVGAQALLPWLFWAWRGSMRAPRQMTWLALAAALLALLAATHTITFLLTLPCLAAYVVMLAVARRDGALLAAPVGAAFLAALLSAVIWLPQLLERGNLSTAAWSTPLLLDNLWRWQDFVALDLRFRAVDGGQTPYRLGAVQVWLLLAGLILTRRRTAEWWFWVGVLGVCTLLMSPLSAPLWASIPPLAVIQFPWRLLSVAGLATALIGAGVVTGFTAPAARAIATALIVAFIVLTQTPRALRRRTWSPRPTFGCRPHRWRASRWRRRPTALATMTSFCRAGQIQPRWRR